MTASAASGIPPPPGLPAVWLCPVLLLLLIATAYARAPRLGFVFDDDIIIRNDPFIQSPQNIPRYFTGDMWSGISSTWKTYYRPVLLLWLLGNYSAFGMKPGAWHLATLCLHLGISLFVYWIALRLTRNYLAALFAGLFFGLHPIEVEVVAWLSAASELLGTFFALAAFLCYLRAQESRHHRVAWLVASPVLYATAALAKETAVLLPAIIFLHEWLGRPACAAPFIHTSRRKAFRAALLESAPFIIIGVLYLAVRVVALGSLGQVAVHLGARILLQTVPSVLITNLMHVFWPFRLSVFYDFLYVQEFSAAGVLLPLAVVVVVGLLVFQAVRKSPAGQFAAGWAILPWLPCLLELFLALPFSSAPLFVGNCHSCCALSQLELA
jgi:hypothetical protein